jgi:hypothetical protein
LEAGR